MGWNVKGADVVVRNGLFVSFRAWARLKYTSVGARGKLARVLGR